MGRAVVSGPRDAGPAAAVKHFPGLGGARLNADLVAQRLTLPLEALRRVDVRPFAAGIPAGAQLVMRGSPATRRSTSPRALFPPGGRGRTTRPARLLRRHGDRRARRAGAPALRVASADRGTGGDRRQRPAALRNGGLHAQRALTRAAQNGKLSRREMRLCAARVLALRASLRGDSAGGAPRDSDLRCCSVPHLGLFSPRGG